MKIATMDVSVVLQQQNEIETVIERSGIVDILRRCD